MRRARLDVEVRRVDDRAEAPRREAEDRRAQHQHHHHEKKVRGNGEYHSRLFHTTEVHQHHEEHQHHPEPHAVLVENRKRGRELCGSRRDRYAHRQDVVREERCSRHLRGERPQIVSRDHVRASSVGVGVDGLLIGDGDDREKDGDGHRNRERVHESRGAGGGEDEQDLLRRVGGRGKGVGGEDREAHGLADGLVARVGGGKRPSEEPGPPGAPGRMKGRGKGLGHGEGGF